MTKTMLEKIKGMNIPVGAPIEITNKDGNKELRYFGGFTSHDDTIWAGLKNNRYNPLKLSNLENIDRRYYKK